MVDSALKQLSVLPEEYQRFYKRRMLAKIAENLSESNWNFTLRGLNKSAYQYICVHFFFKTR